MPAAIIHDACVAQVVHTVGATVERCQAGDAQSSRSIAFTIGGVHCI